MTQPSTAPNGKAKTPPYRIEKDRNVPPIPPERYVEVGMVVQHFPDARAGAMPTCAMVMRIGLETIDCHTVHAHQAGFVPFSGVHHIDLQTEKIDNEGAWRHLPMNLAMLKFMIASGELVWDGESLYRPPAPKEVAKAPAA